MDADDQVLKAVRLLPRTVRYGRDWERLEGFATWVGYDASESDPRTSQWQRSLVAHVAHLVPKATIANITLPSEVRTIDLEPEAVEIWRKLVVDQERPLSSVSSRAGTAKTTSRRFDENIAPVVAAELLDRFGPPARVWSSRERAALAESANPDLPSTTAITDRGTGSGRGWLIGAAAALVVLSGLVAMQLAGSSSGLLPCDDLRGVDGGDCIALLDLYSDAGGPNWEEPPTGSVRWFTSEDPCTAQAEGRWHGVACSGDRISEIALPAAGLDGSLPDSIGRLSELVYLDLSSNSLTGTVPQSMGALGQLDTCLLGDNQWARREIGPVATLLDQSCPGWDSEPWSGCENAVGIWIADCEVLVEFWDLNGENWTPNEWDATPQKNWLETNSPCAGPEYGWSGVLCRDSRVEVLYLGEHSLVGVLPDNIGQLGAIKELHLYNNQVEAPLPESLTDLQNLGVCYLNGNGLGDVDGSADLIAFLDSRCPDWRT